MHTVCEIFAFKLYGDLETGVRGHSMSSKLALFDRAHTTFYSSSIVTMPLSIRPTVSEIAAYWSKIATPLYLAPPLGVKPSDLRNDPWWRKTRVMDLSFDEWISMIRLAVLIQYTRVTDGRTELAWHIRAIAYAVARKNDSHQSLSRSFSVHQNSVCFGPRTPLGGA